MHYLTSELGRQGVARRGRDVGAMATSRRAAEPGSAPPLPALSPPLSVGHSSDEVFRFRA